MTELDKLEEYLKSRGEIYSRVDKGFDDYGYDKHGIYVFDAHGNKIWDVICQRGSYGYKQGLLELYGDLVDADKVGDLVIGWLSASDVIKMVEDKYGSSWSKHL